MMRRDRDRDDRRSRRDRDGGRGSRFKYRARGKDSVNKRANQKGGAFDSPFGDVYPMFSPKAGDHKVRFLPPTWDDPEHFGYDVWVHYGVGPDKQRYLCPNKMKGESCPVCEEVSRAQREQEDSEYINSLKAKRRVAVLLIDRKNESVGPQLWAMPWMTDRDIGQVSQDKESGDVFAVDHPTKGYDVMFTVTGQGKQTQYGGFQLSRKPRPISDDDREQDKWLEKLEENPIPDLLTFYPEEQMEKALSGISSKRDEDDEDDEDRPRGRRTRHDDDDDDDDRPRSKRRRDDDDDEDDDDDDEDRPRKRRRDDDEIDDEDEDLDDDDEDEDLDDDDDDDDRPRSKRRRDDDDDDEDRPRKRRRDDDEEESTRTKIRKGLKGKRRN